jgi:hypothetical protein
MQMGMAGTRKNPAIQKIIAMHHKLPNLKEIIPMIKRRVVTPALPVSIILYLWYF